MNLHAVIITTYSYRNIVNCKSKVLINLINLSLKYCGCSKNLALSCFHDYKWG